jgi:hypothetical protein
MLRLATKIAAVVTGTVAAVALAATPAHADVRHLVATHNGILVASATVTLTWRGPHTYNARICLKDEFRDNRGPNFQFTYVYADGTEPHPTRVWANGNGFGTTVCHSAFVDWLPDIDFVVEHLWADGPGGRSNPDEDGWDFDDNPYA